MTLDITATDMFCGAGGSTTGATLAGATVRLAINHWKCAIQTHHTNYPNTTHVLTDLHQANPRRFPSTTVLIASPECTSHSLAKGKKRRGQDQPELPGMEDEPALAAEAEERSRCTMWTPLDWAEYHNYQAVILENVVDAHLWRPFQSWLHAWRSLDYEFEMVYLNSMHAHPTPQSRDRMYFVAWKRGNRNPDLRITPLGLCHHCEKQVEAVQSWKNPNRRYGKYKQQYVYRCPSCAQEVTPYYYAAANAIDWSIPTPRIGDRPRPLRAKTMQRIAYGLEKVACTPFVLQVNKTSDRVRSLLQEVLPTQTGDNGLAMILPFLLTLNHPAPRAMDVVEHPFPTQTAYDDMGITLPPAQPDLSPFILDHLGEYRPRAITRPFSTICASGNHHSVVLPPAWLMTYYNHGQLLSVQEALPTVTTLARHALVIGAQQPGADAQVQVEDCGFRMLAPGEIQAAMAFPVDYKMTGTRREQVKQLGNAVTPPVMELLMRRVIASLQGGE